MQQGLLFRLLLWKLGSGGLVDTVVDVYQGDRPVVDPAGMRIYDVHLASQVVSADLVDVGVSELALVEAVEGSPDHPGEVLDIQPWLLLGQDEDLKELAVDDGVKLGDVFDDLTIVFQAQEWLVAGIHLVGILGLHHLLSEKIDDVSCFVFHFDEDPAGVKAVQHESDDDRPLVLFGSLAEIELEVHVQDHVVPSDEEQLLELLEFDVLWQHLSGVVFELRRLSQVGRKGCAIPPDRCSEQEVQADQ